MTMLSAPGTRVLLIGTGAHSADSDLPPVPAVVGTLADLGQVLVERCGLAEENLRVVRDPANPTELGIAVAQEAERTEGVLWVYYVGHGLVNPAGELYLATAATDSRPGWVGYTALAYSAIRGSLLQSPARSIVVVLDCCFSGHAVGFLGDAEGHGVDLARVHGGYVLAAAARDELALATPGAPHTAFTGELIRLLTEGDPEGPQQLTLRQVYRYLNRTLPARGFPRPRHHASARIDDLVLCPNPAYRPTPLSPVLPVSTPVTDDAAPQTCPYPGLAAFGPGQAQWFFGRDRLTAELAERLAGRMDATDPLVIVGPSGSGKSSLLGAGLLTALGKGDMPVPGSKTWPHLLLTPTEHPLAELATRLARLTGTSGGSLREELADDPRRLLVAIREMLQARAGQAAITGSRLVLVVDQFEETFTQCADVQQRKVFISALCAAACGDGAEPPALVVLSMHSDFQDHCVDFPELRPALNNTPLFIGPMTASELREAIEQPAQLTGLALQPGLVDIVLRDLGADRAAQYHDPEALPLLSHALRATFQHREDRMLTVAGYVAAGGIRNAVETTAEATYGAFNSTEQQIARSLLLRLVYVGEGTQDTRHRASHIRLFQGPEDPDAAASVLENLVRAGLVAYEKDTVEITHEALLRAWPRLREWIDSDRPGLRIYQQLAKATDAWNRQGRNPAKLYRASRLSLVRDWASDPNRPIHPTPLEREFLNTSIHAVRRRRRLVGLPVVAACFLLLLTGITRVVYDYLSGDTDASTYSLSDSPTLRSAKKQGMLHIGIAADKPGWSEFSAGKAKGFDVDLALYIAKSLSFTRSEVRFVPVGRMSRAATLATGQIDLVIDSYSMTTQRESKVDFAGPYYLDGQTFLVRDENETKSATDLNGKIVCTAGESISEGRLLDLFPKINFEERAGIDECVEDLLDNNSDAVAGGSAILSGFVRSNPKELRILETVFEPVDRYGVAMRIGDPALRHIVCDSIKDYANSGNWQSSYRKYLASPGFDSPNPPNCETRPQE
ncbi:transporter substrate-binding domain-containing protein [Streptomyces hygroscopicus]|uniref:caspase, EACC1-associated type n=1 Tax=Streptomyces hygroscopicus TaxID=1912 RepID=UPI00367E2989